MRVENAYLFAPHKKKPLIAAFFIIILTNIILLSILQLMLQATDEHT